MPTNIIRAQHSPLSLAQSSKLIRLPRAPKRKRSKKFWDNFDSHTLVYDVFWLQENKQVLLVCPPALNLEANWHEASFHALPSNKKLRADFHILRSTMSIALNDVPKDSEEIKVVFNGITYVAKIQQNLADKFAGTRLMFTMSKDNPLSWIREWAQFHQIMHNVDSIIFFDNSSTIYQLEDIEKTLASVKGIKNILVMSLSHKYGPHDRSVIMYRFWANFLQLSSFSIMFRRFAGKAFGILNCDIDELVVPMKENIFDIAKQSEDGLLILKGRWVEGVLEKQVTHDRALHKNFAHVRRDFTSLLNAKKWVLDPHRKWLKNLDIHPAVHKIRNAPKHIMKQATKGNFWHFKGINTNWKEQRNKRRNKIFLMQYRSKQLEIMFKDYAKRVLKQND
jgi:hypothetical protein